MLHSAPVAPIRGIFLSYSLRCLGCSSPWHLVRPRTIQSGGLGRAPLRPGCSNPGRLFVVFSPLPQTLQSVALGSPPDDPVRGLAPCFIPPPLLQSGASFYGILSVASDLPVRGTWFTPRRSSPGASAVLHFAPVAPFQGVFLTYSLRCLGCSSPWHRVLPRTIQSGGLGRAPLRPGCSNPGRLYVVFSSLPRTLQSVAPGSSPDDPVRVIGPSSTPPRMLQSGASCFFPFLLPFGRRLIVWCFVPFFFPRAHRRCSSPAPPVPLSLAPCPVPRFVVRCARFPGSRHPVAVVAWHLSSCRGCGRRRASLACLVAPRWCAAPRPVRSLSVPRLAFPSPWCLPPPQGLSPPALLGGCAGHVEAGREPGSLCLPQAPAKARALGALRVVPVRGPVMGLSLAGPSGFGLGLRALRSFGVCGPRH